MKRAKQSARRRELHNQRRRSRVNALLGKLLIRKSIASPLGESDCDHDWQRDGQTMTGVRWYCVKCGASKIS